MYVPANHVWIMSRGMVWERRSSEGPSLIMAPRRAA